MLNQRPPRRPPPDSRPALHHKPVYRVEQFADDLDWLADHSKALVALFVDEELPVSLREAVMMSVAYENRCRYCAFMHGEWAIEAGLDPQVERELITLQPETVSKRTWTAAVYARQRVVGAFGPITPRQRRLIAEHFTEREQFLVEVTARTMHLANGVANSFDALLGRLRGTPAPASNLLDELLFGTLFTVSLPVGATLLAVITGHHPIDLLSRFFQFSALFERRVRDESLPTVRDIGLTV